VQSGYAYWQKRGKAPDMSFNTLIFFAMVLVSVQMLIVWLITVANKQYFTGPAAEYAQCIKRLGKDKPMAALAMKICYGASMLEVAGLALLKGCQQ
jgi:hypothetical protein